MKKYIFVPALTLVGGIAAFLLRLMEIHTGYESATGLPVPGNVWRYLLAALLAVLAVLLILLGGRLPDEKDAPPVSFSSAFFTLDAGMLVLPAAGVFLMAASGVLELAAVFWGRSAGAAGAPVGSLLPVVSACRRPGSRQAAPSTPRIITTPLLVPVVCLVVRLVFTYRIDSITPALSVYYVELLAIVFLTLAFYRLSSFAFRAGRTSRFIQYASMAVILCCATLADGHAFSAALMYIGCALTLLGFLLLRLNVLSRPRGSR